jgi:hypothetical protein
MPPRSIKIPLIGPSSKAGSSDQQSGRTVNMYPEVNDPDARAVVALHNAPGNLQIIDISDTLTGTASIRGLHRMGERLFFVANQKIVEAVDLDNNALIQWASLPTFAGRVGMSDNNGKLVIGDGAGFYVLNPVDGSLTQVLNDESEPIRGTFSAWIGGITVYEDRTEAGRFRYSSIGDPLTVNGLDFATAEGQPDALQAILAINNELILLGDNSVEFWAFTGDADNAFERIGGGPVTHGCGARWSAREFTGAAVMVGRDKNGDGIIWRLGSAGSAPQRISTNAVERDLYAALQEELEEEITAWTYQDHGEDFYVLNIPATAGTPNQNRPAAASKTWVYQAGKVNDWHERAHTSPVTGLFERSKADHHAYWKGKHLVATFDDAAIYWQDTHFFRDNVLPLVKYRETAGPISFGGQRFSVNELEIFGQKGVGRDLGVQGSDPQLMLQVCWDGRWSNEIWRPWGKIGETASRSLFHRLGSGRELVLRVSMSDPIPFVLTEAVARVTVG